jgi:hypothetical protein
MITLASGARLCPKPSSARMSTSSADGGQLPRSKSAATEEPETWTDIEWIRPLQGSADPRGA